MDIRRSVLYLVLIGLLSVLVFVSFSTAVPDGADNLTPINSTSRVARSADSLLAIAGNVTEADFSGTTVTRFWQGFYGNVTGVISLEDSGGNVIYNWTATNPRGEIYAANETTTISWLEVMCLNYTATDPRNTTGTAGGYGTNTMNLTELHRAFGFNVSLPTPDNVSATFRESNTHDQFFVGSLTFATDECPTAYIFNQNSAAAAGSFEEAILWDPRYNATIWTSLLEDNLRGFDQKFHDFEMLVLENGAGTDTQTTLYYFWVELE